MKFLRTEHVDTQHELRTVTLEDILKAFVVMHAEDLKSGQSMMEVIDNNLLDLGELVADTIEELVDLSGLTMPIEE